MAKAILVLAVWFIALTPVNLFLLARYIFAPEGFWQNLVLFGVGIYVLGGFQIFFSVVGLAVTVVILISD